MGKIEMLKAENAYTKATNLKSKKVAYEIRLEHYRRACRFFDKAYEMNPGIFTLTRIEEALDSCWRAGDTGTQDKFRSFSEKYSKEHPVENEYGDSLVNTDLMNQ